MKFFQRLAAINADLGHQLCAGIDLHMPTQNWQPLLTRYGAEEVLYQCSAAMVHACKDHLRVYKLQSAFYEAHGVPGFAALKRVIDVIHQHQGVVILDAKRGDISTTMAAYGQMAFTYFAADALTVLPYMGISTLTALEPWLATHGVYAVWVSSNPDGATWQSVTQSQILRDCLTWSKSPLHSDSLGYVLGATKVATLAHDDWTAVQNAPLLLPGFGAQGAAMDARHQQILQQSPASVFPVSRGLCDFDAAYDSDIDALVSKIAAQVAGRLPALIRQFSKSIPETTK